MNNIDIKYNKKNIVFVIGQDEIPVSYKEARKLNAKLNDALSYKNRFNIITCPTCKGKKQIEVEECEGAKIRCLACGGRGYIHKRMI